MRPVPDARRDRRRGVADSPRALEPRAAGVALRYPVPVVLCVIALLQIHLVHAHGLTPWKGGGFGMFASVDKLDRPIRITLVDPGGEEFAVDASALYPSTRAYQRVQALPTQRRLTRAADLVLAERWVAAGDAGRSAVRLEPGALVGEADLITPGLVRVEVFRIVYDPDRKVAGVRLLREVERSMSHTPGATSAP